MATGTMAAVDYREPGWWERLAGEYNKVRLSEPLITEDVEAVTRKLGTSLEGLEYSVKTASSLEERLYRFQDTWDTGRPFNPVKEMGKLVDLVRYTEVCRHDDIVDVTRKTIREMEEKGYALAGLRNFYARPFKGTGYMGVHLTLVSPAGQRLELQVHSPKSLEAKNLGHALYEKIRAVGTLQDEKERLREQVFAIHGAVPKPRGFESLRDYRMPTKEVNALVNERRRNQAVDLKMRQNHGEDMETLVYTVSKKNTSVLHGFECHFPDGSVWSYKNWLQKDRAERTVIDPEGREISSRPARARMFSIDAAEKAGLEQIQCHAEWMKERFPDCLPMDRESIAETGRDIPAKELIH